MRTVDVLIVGGGPVGITAANLLGLEGLSVLAVDLNAGILQIPRAIGMDEEGSRVLQATGLADSVFAGMHEIDRLDFRGRKKRFLSCSLAAKVDGYCRVRTFRQPELERRLRDGLDRFEHVELALQTRATHLDDDGDGVTVHLEGPEGPYAVRAQFVFGCDGARSFVRRQIGATMVGRSYAEPWVVIDARNAPRHHSRTIEFLCDPARPGVTLPAPQGGRRWEFMLTASDTRESVLEPAFLSKVLARWGTLEELDIERAAVYDFDAKIADRFQRGNVFLLGDAAHLTPPFAGQGLCAGLRDAANASWKAAAVVHGAPAAILDTYDRERRDNVENMIGLARFIGTLVTTRSRIAGRVRDRVLEVVGRTPVVGPMLTDIRVKPRNRLKDGLLSPVRGQSSATGLLFPQERCADGKLSDEFSAGWRLVGVGMRPTDYLTVRQQQAWSSIGGSFQVRPVEATDGCALTSRVMHWDAPLPEPGIYVVRPDHHVYAAVTLANPGPLESIMRELLRWLPPRPVPASAKRRALAG